MANSTNPAPSSAALGTTSGSGSRSTTKAGVLGYILGLATAGILYLVTKGKGKRSNESGSASPMPEGEPTPLPSTAFPVDDDVHDVNDGCTAEAPVNHHAPAGQRKLTDEDVETIRAKKAAGISVKELASLYGVSTKAIYARLKRNSNHQKQNESQDE